MDDERQRRVNRKEPVWDADNRYSLLHQPCVVCVFQVADPTHLNEGRL